MTVFSPSLPPLSSTRISRLRYVRGEAPAALRGGSPANDLGNQSDAPVAAAVARKSRLFMLHLVVRLSRRTRRAHLRPGVPIVVARFRMRARRARPQGYLS